MTVTCESQGGYDEEDDCSSGKKISQICYPNNNCYYRKCQYDSKADCEKHVNINRYKCLSETVDDTTCYYAVAKSCSEIDAKYKSSYDPETEEVDDTIIDANGNKCYKTHKKPCDKLNTSYRVACPSLGGRNTGVTGSDGACLICYTCADKGYNETVKKDTHCWKCNECELDSTKFQCNVRKNLAASEYMIDPVSLKCRLKKCSDKGLNLKTAKDCDADHTFRAKIPAVRASDGLCGRCVLKTCKQRNLVAKADCDTTTNNFTENTSVIASNAPCGTCTKIETGCTGTEVMVGDKCVELAAYYPEKELSIENLAPYASFSNNQLCPERTVTLTCPESGPTYDTECHYKGSDLLKNLYRLWNKPLEMTSIYKYRGRLEDISEIQDAMKGKMCKDTNCTDTVTLSQIINGSSYVTQRDATTAADYMQKVTKLKNQFNEEQKKDPRKCYDKGFVGGLTYSVGNCIYDVNNSTNTLYGFVKNQGFIDYSSLEPAHDLSFEELIDYYSKNPWKSDRTNKIFTFAFSKDVGTNYNYYGKIKLTSADEYAMAGYSKANYFQDHHGSYTIFKNDNPIKVKLNSFSAQNRGNIVSLSIEAKSFTFGGGLISYSNIKADTVTFNGDTTLENVVIEANTIKFNNNSSLYVTGDNNFIGQKVNLDSKEENAISASNVEIGRFKKTEFSGSAGAIYVNGGNIYIYGNASEPVFSEFAVHEGKAQIMSTNSIAKKYSVKDWGKISIRRNPEYQYALKNFYYTDGKSAPQSGVDVAQYVVNDIILGNEYLCATKTCNSFGAYSKEEGWNPEYADEKRIETVCDDFTDKNGKSFECKKGSIPMYCVASNNACRYEIEDTYLSDLKSNGLVGYGPSNNEILALCTEVSSEQNVNLKCNEVLENSEFREDGYIFNSTRVKPFGQNGSKKCAICLYDSTEGQ